MLPITPTQLKRLLKRQAESKKLAINANCSIDVQSDARGIYYYIIEFETVFIFTITSEIAYTIFENYSYSIVPGNEITILYKKQLEQVFEDPKSLIKKTKNKKFIGFNCVYCGINLDKWIYSEEHIVPRSKGGNNKKENKIACCKNCNSRRSNTSFTLLAIRAKGQRNEKLYAASIALSKYVKRHGASLFKSKEDFLNHFNEIT